MPAETLIIQVAFCLPRVGALLLIMPLLSRESVPTLVRNCFTVCLIICIYPIALSSIGANNISGFYWPTLLIKEALIGGLLGFSFGSLFWAINVAGSIIDSQIGANMANMIDPVQSSPSTMTSNWLGRLVSTLFLASGGFLVLLDVLISSYKLWPITHPEIFPVNKAFLLMLSELEFITSQGLFWALPVILLLSLIDLFLGLVNRFSQQINLLALSLPIKTLITLLLLCLSLSMIGEVIIQKFMANQSLSNIFTS